MNLQRVSPGFDPHGIDHLLRYPAIAAAVRKPMVINNRYCVPYGAGRSDDDRETYVDRHMPQYHRQFLIAEKDDADQIWKVAGFEPVAGRQPGDLWSYVDKHEKTEFAAMTKMRLQYETAHSRVALPIEKWFVEADGGSWTIYQALWRADLDNSEHDFTDPPPNLYLGPYPERADRTLEAHGDALPSGPNPKGRDFPRIIPIAHNPFQK